MNHSELVREIAKKSGVSQDTVKAVLNAQRETVVAAVAAGESVAIHGLGKFYQATSAARTGKNPATGETIEISAKKRLAFKPASGIKAVMNGVETV